MVAKDTSYGSETHRPYLDIERIINVQSACSVNRGHDPIMYGMDIHPALNEVVSRAFNSLMPVAHYHHILEHHN